MLIIAPIDSPCVVLPVPGHLQCLSPGRVTWKPVTHDKGIVALPGKLAGRRMFSFLRALAGM
jgi:hypothetical protein